METCCIGKNKNKYLYKHLLLNIHKEITDAFKQNM